ncbi:hypothetical protein AB0N59_13400 [Microbacterium sp. NPDC089321]|uniref:hypothetical protein n=1 Tax=Microbacterium sp. NPDC089321 TaxID=3155183 RepID=UPI0034137DE4
MTLPEPACTLGYTATQLGEILGDRVDAYRTWAVGKTQGVCEGKAPCAVAHGIVDYADDVTRFIRSR